MSKRITVIGTGYVGLVSSVGLSDFGNNVVGVDLNESIVSRLNTGEPTIYEHGIDDYLRRNLEANRLSFTTDAAAAVGEATVAFLAVGAYAAYTAVKDVPSFTLFGKQFRNPLFPKKY